MNDDFIYKALPKVPQAFSQSLYAQISAKATPQEETQSRLRRLRWLQASTIVFGLFILVAWSQLRFWVRYVPIGDLWLVEFDKATQEGPPALPFVPTPMPTPDWSATIIPTGYVIISFNFPSWLPQGFYTATPCPGMCYVDAIGLWVNDSQQEIHFRWFSRSIGEMHPYAPAGMWKEVNINGRPGVLIYGRLALKKPGDKMRKWDGTLGLQLYWNMKDYVYILETFGPYLSEEDLIRMAESAKEPPWMTATP